jgi:hypothetical protein
MVQVFKGDSYVVDIISPAKTAPYPMVYICPRKKVRQKGQIALDPTKEKFLPVSTSSFDNINIDDTARQIGRAILDNSDIIQDFITRRH